jgi:hypothetical protein
MLGRYIAKITPASREYWLLSSDTQRAYQKSLVSGWERTIRWHGFRHWQSLVIQPYFANLQPQFRGEQCLFPELKLYRHLADVP